MKCPRCILQIHRSAPQCPHCGFALQDLDIEYGSDSVLVSRLNDSAGVLRLKERKKAQKWFDRFEATFPQLFFSVYYGSFEDASKIREYGIWLLNHGYYSDIGEEKGNDGGILLVVDVRSKTACLVFGYLLDYYLREKDAFNVLVKAHPSWLKGDHAHGLKIIINSLTKVLQRRSRKAMRNPAKYQQLEHSKKETQPWEEIL